MRCNAKLRDMDIAVSSQDERAIEVHEGLLKVERREFRGVQGCSGVFRGVQRCSGVFRGVQRCAGVCTGVQGCEGV